MQGPALCVQNNSIFTDNDIESIQKLGVGSKSVDPDKTGQFGKLHALFCVFHSLLSIFQCIISLLFAIFILSYLCRVLTQLRIIQLCF